MNSQPDNSHIENREFLNEIFRNATGQLWTCSFPQSPEKNPPWGGSVYRPGEPLSLNNAHNTYYSVAELSDARRIKKNFRRMAVLVLDDADTSALPIEPSYVIETSPGKHQVGFILNDTREARAPEYCTLALKRLADHGLVSADKSGNNIVRYVRLPVGTNTKARGTGPFKHVLHVWEPSRRYNIPEALSALGIKLDEESTEPALGLESQNNGKLDIERAIGEILTGASFHDNLIRLAAHFVTKGMLRGDIESTLAAAMDASAVRESDPVRWKARKDAIPKAIDSALAKYGNEFANSGIPLDGHPEPLNLFADRLGTIPEWSSADYPETIARLAEDVSLRTGVDPVIPAWTAIAVASALIHDQHTLQIKAHDTKWRESPRFWIAFVGDPSAKKTPGMSEVLAPLKQLQAEWFQTYKDQRKAWEQRVAAAKRDKAPEPEPPHPRKVYVNDITIEALADVLEYNQGGVLALHDELSGWFGSMDCYRQNGVSKDRAAWLTAYNGGPHFVDRVGRGTRHIPNFSVGILGGIQPDPMRRISSRLGDDDGLLQRFIPLPVKAAMQGEDAVPDMMAHEAWEALCRELPGTAAPQHIRLSTDAQKILDDARRTLQVLAQNPAFDKRLQTAMQKGEGQLARLALVFHIIENREDTDIVGDPAPRDQVNSFTATKAARLFLRFIVPNMIKFYHEVVGDSENMALARLAAGYILAHGQNRVTARDLYRAHRELRGHDKQSALQTAMSQLELAGWVSPDAKSSGRSPSAWYVNPRVHSEFIELAKKQRERRERIKAEIQEIAKMSRSSLEEIL